MATLAESPVVAIVADAGAAPPPQQIVGAAAVPAGNPWIVAISVMLATFMEVLDTAIASVALPYIAGSSRSSRQSHRESAPSRSDSQSAHPPAAPG